MSERTFLRTYGLEGGVAMTKPGIRRHKAAAASASATVLLLVVFGVIMPRAADGSTFQDKLASSVATFDSSGRTLAKALVDLAYEYKIPMGIEYLDRMAITRPLAVRVRGEPLRRVIELLVAQLPTYRVTFAGGLVDVYSPAARGDPSNVLNTVLADFQVTNADTHRASAELAAGLARELNPHSMVVNSIAPGQWGTKTVSVHLRGKRVYEILNAITAQNGFALWCVVVPPGRLSNRGRTPWYIYPLFSPFHAAVVEQLRSLFPEPTGGR